MPLNFPIHRKLGGTQIVHNFWRILRLRHKYTQLKVKELLIRTFQSELDFSGQQLYLVSVTAILLLYIYFL